MPMRIARIAADAEDHDLQRHADLRRREAGAVQGVHGVVHVRQQRTQLGGIECFDGLRRLQQQRLAHAQNGSDGHGENFALGGRQNGILRKGY